MSETIPPRWYVVDASGAAWLCIDREDAHQALGDVSTRLPEGGPFQAVLLGDVEALTADRDSWAQQSSDRAQDAVDLVAAERKRIAEAMRGMVRLLLLPESPQYEGDERHTERRMLLALADAVEADFWPSASMGASACAKG